MRVDNGNQTDEELLLLYRKEGDLKILARLYEPYMPLVYGVCLKYLKDREESRDAVMQIFEKLVESLRVHDVTNFKSWLYVMARNYCLMHLRSVKGRKFENITERHMESDEFVHPEIESETEVNVTRLEKCIEELVVDQKKCVQLFYLQKKCYKEISQLTGYDDNRVKSYIQNGKRNLKICMERNE